MTTRSLKPKQFFFGLLAVNVVLLAAGAAGYYVALGHIKTTSDRLSQQLAEQAAAESQLSDLAKTDAQYRHDIVPILPLLDTTLPRSKNQTEILAQLQQLAGDSGITLANVSFTSPSGLPTATSQTVKAGPVLALPITFQLNGSFNQLQTFLGKVEKLSRFTNVTTLAVTRPDKTKPITYNITLNVYVKP